MYNAYVVQAGLIKSGLGVFVITGLKIAAFVAVYAIYGTNTLPIFMRWN